MKRIYLDANGSAKSLLSAQKKLIETALLSGNPSSFHEHGRDLRAVIDEAREEVARAIGALPKEIIFTSGASEANRLFVDALMEHGRKELKKLSILVSIFEHPSLLKPLLKAADRELFSLTFMNIREDGNLSASLEEIIAADVIIATLAHNETGILPNLNELLAKIPPRTIMMSDISQAFARIEIDYPRIDVMSFSAQKMGGYSGIGGLKLSGNGKLLLPPWPGGGQERGFRPGTESAALIAAFGAAAKEVKAERKAHEKLGALRDYFEAKLKALLPIKILGEGLSRLPNTSAITFYEEDPDALRIACDMAGLSVGFGAACSGLAPEGSFALKSLGLSLLEEKTTVRFSFSSDTKKEEVDEVITRLVEQVVRKKALGIF